MEEKIKEIINNRIVLHKTIVDEFATALLNLFESEKQAYAKEMCIKAWKDSRRFFLDKEWSEHVGSCIVNEPDLPEWLKQNFPEK